MAITVIAPKSSTTATVSKKARISVGNLRPATARTARAKAISVAIGMAHPWIASSSPPTIRVNIPIGISIPASAATTGTIARLLSERDPWTSSCLSSRPAIKKKIANSPSDTQ